MEFIRSQALGMLSENKPDWIGWKGFFSDTIGNLIRLVEDDTRKTDYDYLANTVDDAEEDCGFVSETIGAYRYFYPVEPPKEESKWRPYENIREMFKDRFPDSEIEDIASIALAIMKAERFVLKDLTCPSSWMEIQGVDAEQDQFLVGRRWIDLKELFEDYEWENYEGRNTTCGIKE